MALFEDIKTILLEGVKSAEEINSNRSSEQSKWVVPADPASYAAAGIERLINEIVSVARTESYEKGRKDERMAIIKSLASG